MMSNLRKSQHEVEITVCKDEEIQIIEPIQISLTGNNSTRKNRRKASEKKGKHHYSNGNITEDEEDLTKSSSKKDANKRNGSALKNSAKKVSRTNSTKRSVVRHSDHNDKSTDDDDEQSEAKANQEFSVEKNELFADGDVAGKTVFSFGSSSKNRFHSASRNPRNGTTPVHCTPENKILSAVKHGRKNSGEKSSGKRKLEAAFAKVDSRVPSNVDESPAVPKTPYALRTNIKKRIAKFVTEDEESNESDSDFEESDDSDGSSSESGEEQVIMTKTTVPPGTPQSSRTPARKKPNYVYRAQDYFTLKKSRKDNKTSDNSLSKLKKHFVPKKQSSNVQSHQKHMDILVNSVRSSFRKWMFLLSQNFNLLLYGLGSKKNIINCFRKDMLEDCKVVVVNGFFPSLTVKDILDLIAKELLNIKETAPTASHTLNLIKSKLELRSADHIYLLINNIDGPCLKGDSQQSILSSLISINKVHLVASIDHVNAPLIWDNAKLGYINPVWIDTTTFEPYISEISFENSFLVKHNSSTLALSSLLNVYKSLTKNAKRVYSILVEDHLANLKNKNYQGMAFNQLYCAARREMIVSSDTSLRNHLTEFFDHELVKWKRDNEHLIIPIDISVLQKFLAIIEES